MTEQRALCQAHGCHTRNHTPSCTDDTCRGCIPRRAQPGRPLCDTCEQKTWEATQTIARAWPDTEHQLTTTPPRGEPVRTTRNPGLNLNPTVIEARTHITTETTFWAHVITDTAPTLTPRNNDVPTLATFIGTNLRHITHHHDHHLAATAATELQAIARLTWRTAYPRGARRYTPGILCLETDCAGAYQAWVWDGMPFQPDLTCDTNPEHVLTPASFRRLRRAHT